MDIGLPRISIIIPVLNEENDIAKVLTFLKDQSGTGSIKEILVVDGGSSDTTVAIARRMGADVIEATKGRAKQMNLGANAAQGEILYFLHVDTLPAKDFDELICNAVQNGHEAGCFRMKFDSKSKFLAFFAWFTKLNFKVCRGGDQSLFITKRLFKKTGGFNESYIIYEDNEFTDRLYDYANFKILPRHVITSARRYKEKGEIKLQFHFGMIHLKNYLGAGPEKLYDYYRKKIAY
ncbi:TIGR04283 family arsenosugar biosynthesis glycosyltransferase [Maribacter halichondriae]|uniref:TIGR04283 family arsenosugar biosynthesis glycosyltransferase n=1 Tax=Maribacter halichondriae TaxID=2980554 RepID=UPI0023591991|nr:TIGR04283 family arsenosugar biosynthesis glycosyltransferase [Maribacter sp. Hal144]